MIEQRLSTALTELAGVRHPVVQTGMGWVAGPRLVSATANAGGLGHPGLGDHDVAGVGEGDRRGSRTNVCAVRGQSARRCR
ncbi:MAG: nitronate monooxygenase [Nocardioides sp.]